MSVPNGLYDLCLSLCFSSSSQNLTQPELWRGSQHLARTFLCLLACLAISSLSSTAYRHWGLLRSLSKVTMGCSLVGCPIQSCTFCGGLSLKLQKHRPGLGLEVQLWVAVVVIVRLEDSLLWKYQGPLCLGPTSDDPPIGLWDTETFYAHPLTPSLSYFTHISLLCEYLWAHRHRQHTHPFSPPKLTGKFPTCLGNDANFLLLLSIQIFL